MRVGDLAAPDWCMDRELVEGDAHRSGWCMSELVEGVTRGWRGSG
jgi:hypothetical protein